MGQGGKDYVTRVNVAAKLRFLPKTPSFPLRWCFAISVTSNFQELMLHSPVQAKYMGTSSLGAEMEKRADGADASVLFFLLGCANFLAVYVQIR